jgi:(2Fe-2S) ferredoxin
MSDTIFDKHIFICTNQRPEGAPRRSCGEQHGMTIVEEFRKQLKEKKLPLRIRAQKSGCLDICDFGQTVAIYPEGVFYVNVQLADVAEIIEEHVVNNRPVERLRFRRRVV